MPPKKLKTFFKKITGKISPPASPEVSVRVVLSNTSEASSSTTRARAPTVTDLRRNELIDIFNDFTNHEETIHDLVINQNRLYTYLSQEHVPTSLSGEALAYLLTSVLDHNIKFLTDLLFEIIINEMENLSHFVNNLSSINTLKFAAEALSHTDYSFVFDAAISKPNLDFNTPIKVSKSSVFSDEQIPDQTLLHILLAQLDSTERDPAFNRQQYSLNKESAHHEEDNIPKEKYTQMLFDLINTWKPTVEDLQKIPLAQLSKIESYFKEAALNGVFIDEDFFQQLQIEIEEKTRFIRSSSVLKDLNLLKDQEKDVTIEEEASKELSSINTLEPSR